MPNDDSATRAPIGVLLLNLGTPASPAVPDVRRYLREFLGDPKVLTMPSVIRRLVLNLWILPFRPRKTARAYAKIWLEEGSPLMVHGRGLRDAVATELGKGFHVELAMRYQTPDIGTALKRMDEAKVQKIVALPLFPQYSEASTGSSLSRLEEENEKLGGRFQISTLDDFYDEPGFIHAQAETIRPLLCSPPHNSHVLFSYHGLPESQIRRNPGCLEDASCCEQTQGASRRCYRAQCFATTRALATALDLEDGTFSTAFQSRMGPVAWIKPYTDALLPDLIRRDVRDLVVACPAFTADCLETVEEVGIRLTKSWQELGGKSLSLAPCVNASPSWSRAVGEWVREIAAGHSPTGSN